MMRCAMATAIAFLISLPAVSQTDRVEQNLQTMLEASRALNFDTSQDRAYLLEKQETVRTPVAVVFGYGDNRAACEEIATILSSSGDAGTFECVPVY